MIAPDVTRPEFDWTVIFYLAGDNSLAPSLIPQLKALKDAGFQKRTKVIVRFDPSERGVRTGIFDMNRVRRREARKDAVIGDEENSFVRNMLEDEVAPEELARAGGEGAKGLVAEAKSPDTTGADKSLADFLDYCVSNHTAKHYLLFLVGHGMVVGNDAFLPDERPATGVTLERLDQIVRGFAQRARDAGGALELLSLHSCSMSAVEVAYQLRGTARYMMASEGISFVGSLPYRQLMMKVLKTSSRAQGRDATAEEVRDLVASLFRDCLHNSTDFTVGGFSADLALCDLGDESKFERLTAALRELTRALRRALDARRGNDLILLAHWRAQSYWQESYADLYDFCRCLEQGCGDDAELYDLRRACLGVIAELELDREDPFRRLVVFSEHIGPTYQYSHGLSVYFPWSEPLADAVDDVLKTYRSYAFTKALAPERGADDSWLAFLRDYFVKTRRAPRRGDRDLPGEEVEPADGAHAPAFLPAGNFIAAAAGSTALPAAPADGKPNPAMSRATPSDSGGCCHCASIKNYPAELSVSREARNSFKNALAGDDEK